MKLKKLLALVLSLMLALTMLTACGGGGSYAKTNTMLSAAGYSVRATTSSETAAAAKDFADVVSGMTVSEAFNRVHQNENGVYAVFLTDAYMDQINTSKAQGISNKDYFALYITVAAHMQTGTTKVFIDMEDAATSDGTEGMVIAYKY
ncbi:hypothetical protein [Faecalibacterium sp. An121]|uniref:hypothetical protein n=1 Tax=Faecalibacterium sp. An121 TaxID=1965550 RepID=UPI000B36897C|nr:hypothetical protein [Faecalibacterium sp. An121]OUQ37252.1 hypothetical protein B5E66_09065 [Faecalibacterium sp. An121]